MRTLIVIGLLAGAITAGFAITSGFAIAAGAEQLSVAQLKEKLGARLKREASGGPSETEDPLKGLDSDTSMLREAKEDSELANQLFDAELTERLTPASFNRIVSKYEPGLDTMRALAFLRDRSEVLDPPPAEWPSLAAPDAETQKNTLELARKYVLLTLLRLPNFLATRTTTRMVSDPGTWDPLGLPNREGLYLAGSNTVEISFQDGKEFLARADSEEQKKKSADEGLVSQGEFGAEAAIVLGDLADSSNGTVAFHHWETTAAGAAAVYRYTVAAAKSHYQVNYICNAKTPFHVFPGYHGSISISPATGAILRMTLVADSKPGDPISSVTSVIEYGPVKIGERGYICPLWSVTQMAVEANACERHRSAQRLARPEKMLNRTSFSNYHRFGSTVTVMPEGKD